MFTRVSDSSPTAPVSVAQAPRRLEPYRVLFPIGLTYGLIGAGLWPWHALGGIGYPGAAHRLLMMQGFEQCFVLGFLLTAMPGLTKGPPCRGPELVLAVVSVLSYGFAVLLGAWRAAEAAFAASVALLILVVASRLRPSSSPRPMELLFVGLGLVFGLSGALMQLSTSGLDPFAGRLISLGMVLSLVLGLGGLLVPTFTGMRSPLAIPGIAGPHERRGRAVLYIVLVGALACAFALEAAGLGRAGATVRAASATVMIVLVWKLVRPPGRRDAPAFALWGSGWLLVTGLWLAALAPRYTLAALHVVFIGGFGLLTMGVATRVVVAHGQHPLADERRILAPLLVATMLLTL